MDYKGLQERAAERYPYLDGTPIEIVDAFRTGWLQGYMECYSDAKPGEKNQTISARYV